jgi:hypothetical protein
MAAPNSTATPAPGGLREAKREQAAARRAAKPAPAKAPAKKQADKTAAPKIAWKPQGEKDANGECESVGTAGDRTYEITRAGDGWKATVKQRGKTTTIVENAKSGKAAWAACVRHSKSVAA